MTYYFPVPLEHIQKLIQEESEFVEKLINQQRTLTKNPQSLFPLISKHACSLVFLKYASKATSSEMKEITFLYLSNQIKSLQYGYFLSSFEYIHFLAISLMIQEQVSKVTSFDKDMYLAPSASEHESESIIAETLRLLVRQEKEKATKMYSKLEKTLPSIKDKSLQLKYALIEKLIFATLNEKKEDFKSFLGTRQNIINKTFHEKPPQISSENYWMLIDSIGFIFAFLQKIDHTDSYLIPLSYINH